MPTLSLDTLFRIPVACSFGSANKETASQLTPLAPGEEPENYHSWVEKRQREYRAGRHHARLALSRAGYPSGSILRDKEGVPLFPGGFKGSISHTGTSSTFALAVVALGAHQVGVDVELRRSLSPEMIQHIVSSAERTHWQTHATSLFDREEQIALLAFCAKEAFYKCTYPIHRTFLSFHDVSFELTEYLPCLNGKDEGVGSFSIRLLKQDSADVPRKLPGRFIVTTEYIICGVDWDAKVPTD